MFFFAMPLFYIFWAHEFRFPQKLRFPGLAAWQAKPERPRYQVFVEFLLFTCSGRTSLVFHRSSDFLALQLGRQSQNVPDIRFCSKSYMCFTAVVLSYINSLILAEKLGRQGHRFPDIKFVYVFERVARFVECASSKMSELS